MRQKHFVNKSRLFFYICQRKMPKINQILMFYYKKDTQDEIKALISHLNITTFNNENNSICQQQRTQT